VTVFCAVCNRKWNLEARMDNDTMLNKKAARGRRYSWACQQCMVRNICAYMLLQRLILCRYCDSNIKATTSYSSVVAYDILGSCSTQASKNTSKYKLVYVVQFPQLLLHICPQATRLQKGCVVVTIAIFDTINHTLANASVRTMYVCY
jgi:hypothetical protein